MADRAQGLGLPLVFVGDESIEMPGTSYFLRDGDRVFHTYSNFARGAEMTGGSYYWIRALAPSMAGASAGGASTARRASAIASPTAASL